MRILSEQLLCLFAVIIECSGQAVIDPCRDFKEIPEINRRGLQYAPSGEEPQVNDYYLDEGWYGKAGYDMLLEAPQATTACGTMTPIYLQGSLPVNIGDTKAGQACVIGWFGNCMVRLPVTVKRCSDKLNVYNLQASTIVFSAYCFGRSGAGTIAPAPDYVARSVQVEVDIDWTKPVITPRATIRMPQIVFTCSFAPVNDILFYQINWFVGSKFLLSKGPFTKVNLRKLVLTETDLKDKGITKLGFTVKCGVRALAEEDGMAGDLKSSQGFFAGIKVKTPRVIIERGKEVSVTLESTVPYGCANIIGQIGRVDSCPAFIETYYTRGASCRSAIGVVDSQGRRRRSAQRCGVQLKETKLKDVQDGDKKNWKQKYTWVIAQMDDGIYQLTEKHFRVKLRVSDGTQHEIWRGYELDDIHVHVEDPTSTWRKKVCKAYCDPHMTTFDGTAYEMQKPGAYVFYKHKTIPIEVQLRSERCVSGVPNAHCPCGVYIRGGSDLYVLSTCTDHPFIDFLLCGDGSLQVFREGDRKYKIFLPTGASVTVTMGYRWQVNVAIDAAPRDTNNVEGLCGNLNGKRADDFIVNGRDYGAITRCGRFQCRNQFIDLYKVSPQNRFFPPTAQNKALLTNLQTLRADEILCLCPLNVGAGVAKSECSSKAFVKCKHSNQKRQTCAVKRLRRKRDVENRLQDLQVHLEQLSKALKRRKRSVPSLTITEAQARIICQSKFDNAGSFQYCHSNVPGIENTQEVENCIFDLHVTGMTEWAEAALDSVTHQCIHEAEKNNSLQNSTDGGPSIAEVIKEITCPNECSGNGNCNNGSCQCLNDFSGSDCSFENHAPIIHLDVGENICDTSKGPCDYINIFGEDFIDSENLTCKIKEYQMDTEGNVTNGESTVTVLGEARSPFEVRCPITGFKRRRAAPTETIIFFQRYIISIANDGTLFGVEKEVFVADSRCQVQTNFTNVFTIKTGHCFIDGRCVAAGESMEGNIKQVCLPQNNTFHWTYSEAATPAIKEPCEIYKEISDISKRKELNQPTLEEVQVNDIDLEEGWYGHESHDMLLKAPVMNDTACGSMSPIWLQGVLPTNISDKAVGSACVVGWLQGCILDIPIEIKKCSNRLNVYYLRPTEVAFSAYCFEMNEIPTSTVTEALSTQESESSSAMISTSSTASVTTASTSTTVATTTSSERTAFPTSSVTEGLSTHESESSSAMISTSSTASVTTANTNTTVATTSSSERTAFPTSNVTKAFSTQASESSSAMTFTSSSTSVTTASTNTTVATTSSSVSTTSTSHSSPETSTTSTRTESTTKISSPTTPVRTTMSRQTHTSSSPVVSTSSPTVTTKRPRDNDGNSGQQSQTNVLIIGLVIGAAVVGLVVVIALVMFLKKRAETFSFEVDHDKARIVDKHDDKDVAEETVREDRL